MEFLVTMTTQVPYGTSQAEVDAVKAREAARSRELASAGRLLRLWRPPLEPGEWRTFGLFDATDQAEIEAVLRSMPLRIWRTDDIVPLEPHANDPGRETHRPASSGASDGTSDFFATFTVTAPDRPDAGFDEANAREATRTRELAGEGLLLRLWMLPEKGKVLGLWRAHDAERMLAILQSLPLRNWFSVESVQLSAHPSDPASMDA